MILYDFLVFLLLRETKRLYPYIGDEEVERITFKCMNTVTAGLAVFLAYVVLPPVNSLYPDGLILLGATQLLWLVTVLVNFLLIVRKARWKRLPGKFSHYTAKERNMLTALTLTYWLGAFVYLTYYWENV
ncbi:hypothetical protein [Rufibacter sp. XAAS-G3-1]|uniref:hypothetical protein n=1 Tax=Rufibacter sp. XAAS-G3-1 TaxID=2729134 RepID=UPI0015E73AE3|nr:hypothetical protein [Rufibacter sp. XAAS-G3-1]